MRMRMRMRRKGRALTRLENKLARTLKRDTSLAMSSASVSVPVPGGPGAPGAPGGAPGGAAEPWAEQAYPMTGGGGDDLDWKKLKESATHHLLAFSGMITVFQKLHDDKMEGCRMLPIAKQKYSISKLDTEFFRQLITLLANAELPAKKFSLAYAKFKSLADSRNAKYTQVAEALAAIEKYRAYDYESSKRAYEGRIRSAPTGSLLGYQGYQTQQNSALTGSATVDHALGISGTNPRPGEFPLHDAYWAALCKHMAKEPRYSAVRDFIKNHDRAVDQDPRTFEALNALVEAVRTKLEEARSHRYDRPTPDMLLERLSEIQSDGDMGASEDISAFSAEDAALFTSELTMGHLFGPMGRALLDALEPLLSALREWAGAAADKAGLSPAAAADLARMASTIKQVVDCSEQLRSHLIRSVSTNGSAVANEVLRLTSLVSSAALDERVLSSPPRTMAAASAKHDGLGFGHGLGAKGELRPPGRGQGSGSGDATGFLFRRIDPVRVARYVEQSGRFLELSTNFHNSDIGAQRATVSAEVQRQDKDAAALAASGADDGGVGVEPGVVKLKLKRLGDERVTTVKRFVKHVRNSVSTYVTLHRRFMTQQHGEGARYMQYWRTVGKVSPAKDQQVGEWLDEHERTMTELAKVSRRRLALDARAEVEAVLQIVSAAESQVRLDEAQMREAGDELDELSAWMLRQSARVERLYQVGSQSLVDSLLEPEVVAMYSFKALRVLIAWLATSFASRAFQAVYRQRVYARDDPPPHPAAFVAMILGADAAAHVLFGVVLLAARHVWGIDVALLRMWAIDWAIVTAAVAAVSLVIAQVVYSKRFFRYKYEGERGIRAMQELVFCVYCVAVPMPFFRLTFG